MLDIIQEWPKDIYNKVAIISAVKVEYFQTMSKPLLQTLALLYIYNEQYLEALDTYLELKDHTAFDIIQTHFLNEYIRDKVLPLMELDCEQ